MKAFRALTLSAAFLSAGIFAIGTIAAPAQAATPHSVVELAGPHSTIVTLTPGEDLWIVAHEPFVFSYDWPMNDKRFWNPPPKIEIKATNPTVFEQAVIADGLSDQDKANFGMSQDDMPLHVFFAKNPGLTDVTVSITPKVPGKQPYTETLHIIVK